MSQYLVTYKVLGGSHQAGPYDAVEAGKHFRDIAGYEGVTDAKVVPVEPKSAHERLADGTGPL